MQATTQSGWLNSSQQNPCPICGRPKDGACSIATDRTTVLCHHGQTHQPPDVAVGETTLGKDGQRWKHKGMHSNGRQSVFTLVEQQSGTPLKVVPLRPPASPSRPYRTPAAPPAGAAPPDLGRATAQWCYRDSDGHPLFWVQRFDTAKGKSFVHRVWLDGTWHLPSRRDGFSCQWPAPRPLYGLPQLQARPEAPVLVAEGEKAADAAAGLLPDHVAVAWCGGCARVGETDWAPLAGRTVVLWPDNDNPGRDAMAKLAGKLLGFGCNLTIVKLPDTFEAGWDLADADANADFGPDRAARLVAEHGKPIEAPPAATPSADAPPAAAPIPDAPFTVLGWEPGEGRSHVWVQAGSDRAPARIPTTKQGLQAIAPVAYWEAVHPSRTGVAWDAAISSLIHCHADRAGYFHPEGIRGRGVWRDGSATVWNLGDRLLVDGTPQAFDWRGDSGNVYTPGHRLPIDHEGPLLTDAEGEAILRLIHGRMTWTKPCDGLLVAGHIVLGNIAGALRIRPGMQYTGSSQDGKSTVERHLVRPLQAGLGVRTSGSTAAGIRQELRADSLPAVIDESEQENARNREDHLKLLRLSFDGERLLKGTAGQRSISYSMRSMLTLIGINATVPNLADRNRLVVVRPARMAPEPWAQFQRDRNALITIEAGRRLLRRTVAHIPALLHNIEVFATVLAGMPGTSRTNELLGTLLAGAHHLTSTAVLNEVAALAWLDAVGWKGLNEEELEAVATDAEGKACLQHLLAITVNWKASQTGSVTVLELLNIVKGGGKDAKDDAAQALGRLGIKFDRGLGLVVSNSSNVFGGSRWANGAHRDRLLELQGAAPLSAAHRFIGWKVSRGVSVPWAVIDSPSA